MTCEHLRPMLEAYHDGELEPERAALVEKHLLECEECAHRLDRLRQLRSAILLSAPRHAAPLFLSEKIAAIPSKKRTFGWGSYSIGALSGLAAAAALFFVFFGHRPATGLGVALVDDHVRSLMATHLYDVESTDRHTVKPWFLGKLDFSPTVIDLASDGFPLLGGRLDYVDGHPAAALVYKRGQHVINVFVLPKETGGAAEDIHGYHIVRWSMGDLAYWAVSDVSRDDLETFAKLFQTRT